MLPGLNASRVHTFFVAIKEVLRIKRKLAVIVVELVDETVEERNDVIKQQLVEWFQEDAVSIPWVKELKSIVIQEGQ